MAEAASAKKPRPKNLDLTTIRLPLPGIVSILHRVSGAGLFLMLPVLLWLFQNSLTTGESYAVFQSFAKNFFGKVILTGLLWAYLHHFCAGIRFLALDFHKGIELESARMTSKLVLAISIPLTLVLAGVLVW